MPKLLHELIRMTGISTSVQELLYAIIMAMIFVYAARFGVLEFAGVGEFILVQFGMLFTWGVIDGIIFYWLGACDQRRYCRIISNDVNQTKEQRIEALMDEFGATPLDVLTEEEERIVCERCQIIRLFIFQHLIIINIVYTGRIFCFVSCIVIIHIKIF